MLQAEIELRRRVEEVAALRRQLPVVGEIPEDYVFEEGAAHLNDLQTVRTVRLSQLFQPAKTRLPSTALCLGRR